MTRFALLLAGLIAAPALAQESAWDRHIAADAEMNAADAAACAAKGGEWAKRGSAQAESCARKTGDGGKICKNGAECEIACVSKLDPRYSKNPNVIGECLRSSARAGCHFYVEGGAVANAVCKE